MGAFHHCVEVPVAQDASARILIDGATGERASANRSVHLDPERLAHKGQAVDSYFEPGELLEPHEVGV
jgi:hypothetical protein